MIKPIKHSGADWMAKQKCFKNPSQLAIKVADILGQVYLGIYHISGSVTSEKVDWQNESDVSVTIYGELEQNNINLPDELFQWWMTHKEQDAEIQSKAKQEAEIQASKEQREKYLASIRERLIGGQLTHDELVALGIANDAVK